MPKPRKPLKRKTPLRAKPDSKRGKRTTSSGDTPKKASLPPKKKVGKKPKEQTLRAKADKIAGNWFRKDASCVACGYGAFGCSSVIQWCHVVRRGCRLIRHSRWNALPLCKSHHVYFTHRPEEWFHFVETLCPGRFALLRELDLSRKGMSLVDVYEEEIAWYAENHEGFVGWDGK